MRYRLFNETDQILASPDTFETKEKAEECAEALRQRFVAQGFYLTVQGTRIRPGDVKLLIVPA